MMVSKTVVAMVIFGVLAMALGIVLTGAAEIRSNRTAAPSTWFTELEDPDGRTIMCAISSEGHYDGCYLITR